MNTLTAKLPFARTSKAASGFDISPVTRSAVILVGASLSLLSLVAIARGLLGFTPELLHLRNVAVVVHVTTVLPAIPLGAYLLLAPKGGKRHKQLGKLWLALMVTTACAAFFIRTGGNFSPIHIFVPLTLISSYTVIASARRGDMKAHKKEIIGLYLGALAIPGAVAFIFPGRLMNVMLLG